jgi:hypothetical protein
MWKTVSLTGIGGHFSILKNDTPNTFSWTSGGVIFESNVTPARAGLELTTSRWLSESTTTRLQQLVIVHGDYVSNIKGSVIFNGTKLTLNAQITLYENDPRCRGWLIIYSFTSRSRIFHLYGDVTNYRWRAAKFRPMLGAQGLWVGRDLYRATPASVYSVTSEGPPHSVAPLTCTNTQGSVEDLF